MKSSKEKMSSTHPDWEVHGKVLCTQIGSKQVKHARGCGARVTVRDGFSSPQGGGDRSTVRIPSGGDRLVDARAAQGGQSQAIMHTQGRSAGPPLSRSLSVRAAAGTMWHATDCD